MANIIKQRMTVQIEGDFVIFIIGMKINKFWKIHKWLPAAIGMPAMLKELSQNKEKGLLGFQLLGGIPPVVIQYWESFEKLEAYAKDREAKHLPVWKAFNKNIGSNGDVGIWHETYRVKAGEYECIYNNMVPYGLGTVGKLVPASGKLEYSAGRIKNSVAD
jgi:hypothetical protein